MDKNSIQKQLAKMRRDKRLLWLGIMFFVLVVLWILTSIFTVAKTSSISQELRDLAKSFVPRLESKSFDEILSKRHFVSEELYSFPIYVLDKKSVDGNPVLINITVYNENLSEIVDSSSSSSATQSGQFQPVSSSSSQVLESSNQDISSESSSIEAIAEP